MYHNVPMKIKNLVEIGGCRYCQNIVVLLEKSYKNNVNYRGLQIFRRQFSQQHLGGYQVRPSVSCISGFIANCYVWHYMRPGCDEMNLLLNVDCGFNECSGDPGFVCGSLSSLVHLEKNENHSDRIIFLCRYIDNFLSASASVFLTTLRRRRRALIKM
jgi:hypothetical protein